MRVQHSFEQDVRAVCDETIEHGFHGFAEKTKSFASAFGALSIEIWSRKIVIFLTVKLKAKFFKTVQKQKPKVHQKEFRVVVYPGVKNSQLKRDGVVPLPRDCG